MEKIDPALWEKVCMAVGGFQFYYSSVQRARTLHEDYEAALEDASKGNERAQQFIAKYTELRLKDGS